MIRGNRVSWMSLLFFFIFCFRLLWSTFTLIRDNELLYDFLEFPLLLSELVPVSFDTLLQFLNMMLLIFLLFIIFDHWLVNLSLLFCEQRHIFLDIIELSLLSLHQLLSLSFLLLTLCDFICYFHSFFHVLLKLFHYFFYFLIEYFDFFIEVIDFFFVLL